MRLPMTVCYVVPVRMYAPQERSAKKMAGMSSIPAFAPTVEPVRNNARWMRSFPAATSSLWSWPFVFQGHSPTSCLSSPRVFWGSGFLSPVWSFRSTIAHQTGGRMNQAFFWKSTRPRAYKNGGFVCCNLREVRVEFLLSVRSFGHISKFM